MADLLDLIEREIPEGKKQLQESTDNLLNVAAYCEDNYLRAQDKRRALEETKNYTTQSLASVAYQINTLAYNMLNLLDLQTNQLVEMESSINHIAQTVAIHKEKVARREIGVLTTNKTAVRQHKIIAPANPERPIKYQRRPIDFSQLDEIGHGVKTSSTNLRTKRIGSSSSSSPLPGTQPANGPGPAPTTKPPTPPQPHRTAGGSISRASKEYRQPITVAAPLPPSGYAPNYPIAQQAKSQRRSNYAPSPVVNPVTPQVGMAYPIAQQQQVNHDGNPYRQREQVFRQQVSPSPPPPPPLQQQESHYRQSYQQGVPQTPPPPPMSPATYGNNHGNVSPPLPPPPEEQVFNYDDYDHGFDHHQQAPGNYMRQGSQLDGQPDWIPKSYLEKVIAIYDYIADKDDELSFSENAVIYVIKKNDDGWYEGICDGSVGLFPGNYVEPCL
ncbi:PREDICTED: abl interactor 1-like isoform X2 [Priapulus caudatus]|uniref:Abl interactor 1-like isoform X2 n=1 Tax=Priapulus caudatus TaxID=37621 RepID=A0ABM1DSZ3_PRICU|nr:PREDICTED: abl interactor 1-like isoform X2 [Priapulus caudatus]